MLVQSIDEAVSRMVCALANDRWSAQASPSRWTARGFLDAGLGIMGRGAGLVRSLPRSDKGRTRWLELQNKILAYRLFQGLGHGSRLTEPDSTCKLDRYSQLFAAEGQSYRSFRAGALALEAPPELNPVAIHAGAGLWLAEKALRNIDDGRCISKVITEFCTQCRRVAFEGFGGIMQEAFGLAVRTLYPHHLGRLDICLRETDARFWERFWHGVGRGIYFVPSNIPPFRSLPWSGVAMCLRESPHETGKRNALSGFGFALAMVNLRSPDVLEAFVQHHAKHSSECADGMQSALAVWNLSCGEREAAETHASGWPMLQSPCITHEERRPERLFSMR